MVQFLTWVASDLEGPEKGGVLLRTTTYCGCVTTLLAVLANRVPVTGPPGMYLYPSIMIRTSVPGAKEDFFVQSLFYLLNRCPSQPPLKFQSIPFLPSLSHTSHPTPSASNSILVHRLGSSLVGIIFICFPSLVCFLPSTEPRLLHTLRISVPLFARLLVSPTLTFFVSQLPPIPR